MNKCQLLKMLMLTSLPLLGTQLDGNEVIPVTSLLHLDRGFMLEVINLLCH
jgi:hypothetical protein